MCSGCGKVCVFPCRVISEVCGKGCDAVGKICSGPFCIYTISALALNIPPIIAGMKGIPYLADGCKGSRWLLVDMCLCGINIAAAWYITVKLQNREDPQLQGKDTTLSRATHILCYDPAIAIYILFLIGFFCCLCVGISWKESGKIYEGCDNDNYNIQKPVATAIGCGFAFLTVGFMTLSCSLCIAGCDGKRYDSNSVYHVMNDHSTQEAPTQQNNYQDVENSIPVATPVENISKPASVRTKAGTAVGNGISAVKNFVGSKAK